LLLHDDDLDDAMDGRAPELLGDLCQLPAALLPHHLAAALSQDLRPEEWHNCHRAALLHEELPARVQLLLQKLEQRLLQEKWLLLFGKFLLFLEKWVDLHGGGGHGCCHGKKGKDEQGLHGGFLFDYYLSVFDVCALSV
jgi:hypothetical protein